jgi:hypothetical protein
MESDDPMLGYDDRETLSDGDCNYRSGVAWFPDIKNMHLPKRNR